MHVCNLQNLTWTKYEAFAELLDLLDQATNSSYKSYFVSINKESVCVCVLLSYWTIKNNIRPITDQFICPPIIFHQIPYVRTFFEEQSVFSFYFNIFRFIPGILFCNHIIFITFVNRYVYILYTLLSTHTIVSIMK